MTSKDPPMYTFGPFQLDPLEQRLLRRGKPVSLTPKTFEMLLLLVERSGHLVEKDELLESLWSGSFVEEANLTHHIWMLRKALGKEGTQYIETVPKRGYRFHPIVQAVGEPAAEHLAAKQNGLKRAGVIESEAGPETRSLAVLPFQAISPMSGPAQFGLGIADALITQLSKLRLFTVLPTSIVRKYVDEARDPVLIGQSLKVDSVLDGAMQRSGKLLRVTVQLVGIKERATIWAEKFDEKLTDVFNLEDKISEQVATALALNFDGSNERAVSRTPNGRHMLSGGSR
jgi:DNA-binding winged helix-turn-helix (wHTH) protein